MVQALTLDIHAAYQNHIFVLYVWYRRKSVVAKFAVPFYHKPSIPDIQLNLVLIRSPNVPSILIDLVSFEILAKKCPSLFETGTRQALA
jgi:hypothetical protein